MNPGQRVDPMAVRSTAVSVASDYTSAGSDFSYHQAAAIHHHVNETINYVPDPRSRNYIAPPEETLETGAGDCDCQAVLVASLLEAIGATTRLATVEAPDGSRHMLPEVYLADEGEDTAIIADDLGDFYGSQGYSTGWFNYETDSSGMVWYPADTAMGSYIGDLSSLSDSGYVDDYTDGSWSWYSVEYHHY